MINIPCGKCGSMNIGKNGTAAAGSRNITAEPAIFTGHPSFRKRNRAKNRDLQKNFFADAFRSAGSPAQSVSALTY